MFKGQLLIVFPLWVFHLGLRWALSFSPPTTRCWHGNGEDMIARKEWSEWRGESRIIVLRAAHMRFATTPPPSSVFLFNHRFSATPAFNTEASFDGRNTIGRAVWNLDSCYYHPRTACVQSPGFELQSQTSHMVSHMGNLCAGTLVRHTSYSGDNNPDKLLFSVIATW